uniref:Uncharacterized protein n=1 Tax=Sphaerodactylus townsendi TaxID=933632 RepID=A0ACB8FKB5_9SAUR
MNVEKGSKTGQEFRNEYSISKLCHVKVQESIPPHRRILGRQARTFYKHSCEPLAVLHKQPVRYEARRIQPNEHLGFLKSQSQTSSPQDCKEMFKNAQKWCLINLFIYFDC